MAILARAGNPGSGDVLTADLELLTASALLLNTMSVEKILALKPATKTDTDIINTFKESIAEQAQQIEYYKFKCRQLQHLFQQKDLFYYLIWARQLVAELESAGSMSVLKRR